MKYLRLSVICVIKGSKLYIRKLLKHINLIILIYLMYRRDTCAKCYKMVGDERFYFTCSKCGKHLCPSCPTPYDVISSIQINMLKLEMGSAVTVKDIRQLYDDFTSDELSKEELNDLKYYLPKDKKEFIRCVELGKTPGDAYAINDDANYEVIVALKTVEEPKEYYEAKNNLIELIKNFLDSLVETSETANVYDFGSFAKDDICNNFNIMTDVLNSLFMTFICRICYKGITIEY